VSYHIRLLFAVISKVIFRSNQLYVMALLVNLPLLSVKSIVIISKAILGVVVVPDLELDSGSDRTL